MTLEDKQSRIENKNREFAAWLEDNPGKRFYDYYAQQVVGKLDRGDTHPTIGGNLKHGDQFNESGMAQLRFLKSVGLEPDHVCVDYGCGSLRVGQHIMEYLHPGNYWGVDVVQRFLDEGVELIGPELISVKRPNLGVINDEILDRIHSSRPNYLLAVAVLVHIPPFELDEFLGRIMRVIVPGTKAFLKYKGADALTQYAGRGWYYPQDLLVRKISECGGRADFLIDRTSRDDTFDLEVRHGYLQIMTAAEPAATSE